MCRWKRRGQESGVAMPECEAREEGSCRPPPGLDLAQTAHQHRTQDTDQTLAGQQRRVLWPMIKPTLPGSP
jgi:hypothetical protein